MTRHSHPKLCMFCAKDQSFGPMTREHFVFKGLWSGPRPKGTKTVWAHKLCNEKYAADNEYVRDILAIDAGAQQHPEVKRLLEGELRRKLRRQPGAIAKALTSLRLAPRFTASGLWIGNARVFDVDWRRVERVLQNVVRGIYYTAVREPLPDDCIIKVIEASETVIADWRPMIDFMVGWQSFGDDVFICRYVTYKGGPRINCVMQFYRKRLFFGEAMSRRFLEQLQSQRQVPGCSRTGKAGAQSRAVSSQRMCEHES